MPTLLCRNMRHMMATAVAEQTMGMKYTARQNLLRAVLRVSMAASTRPTTICTGTSTTENLIVTSRLFHRRLSAKASAKFSRPTKPRPLRNMFMSKKPQTKAATVGNRRNISSSRTTGATKR